LLGGSVATVSYARYAALLILLLLLGVALAAVVSVEGVLSVDLGITREVQEPRLIDTLLQPLMVFVSALGYDFWPYLLLAVAVAWLLLQRQWVAAALVAATALADGLTVLVKVIVARPRPTPDLVEVYRTVSGYSFPSGHVVHYVAFYGIIGYLAWRRLRTRPPPRGLARTALRVLLVLCCVLVALVGPSRVVLGAHWPTDVLGGYLLGGACLLLLIAIAEHLLPAMAKPLPGRQAPVSREVRNCNHLK
jgi:undecaprenyl-diphosphatase